MNSEYVCDDCGEGFESPGPYGAHIRGHQQRVSDEDLLDELRRLSEELGEVPSSRQAEEHGKYSTTTYERFGSWNDALKKAGLDPKQIHKIPTDELLSKMESLAQNLGRAPTMDEWNEQGICDEKVLRNRFGTWNNALAEAGLSPNGRMNIPKEELLNGMRDLGDELGRPPSQIEMVHLGPFSENPYHRNFESWYDALRKSGFNPQDRSRNDDSERYGIGWNPAKREKVRERDSFTCQDAECGMTQEDHREKHGRALHVHHLKRPNEFDNPSKSNELDNLVTLCATHHQKWEKADSERPSMEDAK